MIDLTEQLVLVRHGETEWSRELRHTGWTDIHLSPEGVAAAEKLKGALSVWQFAAVYSSPLLRATQTAQLAGFPNPSADPDLREWNYGAYEGMTAQEIDEKSPDWELWSDGVPEGESVAEVGARARRFLARVGDGPFPILVFAHGHLLRILSAVWTGAEPDFGRHLHLSTASVSVLGHRREGNMIIRWNDTSHTGVEHSPPS